MKIRNKFKQYRLLLFIFILSLNTSGQTDMDLPVIEDFESDSAWIWKPWKNLSNKNTCTKISVAAHSGYFGLHFKDDDFYVRFDKQIGLPGQVISWWIRFQGKTRANFGFGIDSSSDLGYYLCVDPSTNTLHFAKSADYTYPLFKVVNQTYKMNKWYRAEIIYNTSTNITGRLYSSDGKTILNSITLEIPGLTLGGIAFRGLALDLDDIRGGSRQTQIIEDIAFAPKLEKPYILKNVIFDLNKSTLLEQSYVELDKLVAYLKQNSTLIIKLVGHTDNIGKEADNVNLSIARAMAVKDYLVEHRINNNRISCSGLGSSNPIASNATEEGRKKNRRVECIISIK